MLIEVKQREISNENFMNYVWEQKPTGEALPQATIRLKEYSNVRVDTIMKIGMFKLALC